MVKAVSPRQRTEIVSLHQAGFSQAAIARQVGVGRQAVRHWTSNWDGGGDLQEKPRRGRPPVLSVRAKRFARKQLKTPGFGGLGHAAKELHSRGYTDIVVHRSTLSRMLGEPAMKVPTRLEPDRRPPTYALTEHDKARRLAFARANENRDWTNTMFTDRKRFYFRFPGSKVSAVQWHERGERRQVLKPTNPQCVNVYMGITQYGPTGAIVVAGSSKHKSTFLTKAGKPPKNITGDEYKHVMEDHLLPKGQALMHSASHRSWWFQQDNDPTHRAAAECIETYNKVSKTHIQLLPDWPPHSPDLNLIENVWADVQSKLDQIGYKTFDQFQAALMDLLEKVDQRWCEAAFAGMHNRIQETIQAQGGRINH